MQATPDQSLTRDVRTVVNTLLGVGLYLLVIGIIAFAIVAPTVDSPWVLLALLRPPFSIGMVLVGLSFAARKSPHPAAVAGLYSYGAVFAWKVFRASQSADPVGGIAGLGVRWMDIILLLLLIRSVQAGVRYRRTQTAPSS